MRRIPLVGLTMQSVFRYKVARRALALATAMLAPALPAQTLVPNAHLDTGLAPWLRFVSSSPDPVGAGEEPAWQSAPDVNSQETSGSARVRLTPSSQNAKSGIAQCFDFAAPTSVDFLNYGMAFYVPTAAALDGAMRATVEVRLYSGSGCTGLLSGGMQAQTLTAQQPTSTGSLTDATPALVASVPVATWYRIGQTNFKPNDAPVTAASAEIRGYLAQGFGEPTQSDYALNVDHFVLVLNSTTPVTLTHFDID
jgi:hypothetical protein